MKDLFEAIRTAVGCTYISDLRSGKYNRLAKKMLKKADLSEYATNQLIDMAEYIYDKKTYDRETAISVLNG